MVLIEDNNGNLLLVLFILKIDSMNILNKLEIRLRRRFIQNTFYIKDIETQLKLYKRKRY